MIKHQRKKERDGSRDREGRNGEVRKDEEINKKMMRK